MNYDIIWSSPPCPTHSRINFCLNVKTGKKAYKYPDLSLYQEIILLRSVFRGYYVVENVIPYYDALIKPDAVLDRHFFWLNFSIENKKFEKYISIQHATTKNPFIDLSKYNLDFYSKRKIVRNMVNPAIGKYLMDTLIAKINY
jgi:DNA (cytosine-5)-methyltransferase 1